MYIHTITCVRPGQKTKTTTWHNRQVVVLLAKLAEGLLVAGAVVVGLVAAAVVHQNDHFAVVHDALATVHAGVVGHATALVT